MGSSDAMRRHFDRHFPNLTASLYSLTTGISRQATIDPESTAALSHFEWVEWYNS